VSTIDLLLEGDGAWPDIAAKKRQGKLVWLRPDAVIGMAALAGGMTSGRASIAFRFDLPDGRCVFAETSLRALYTATKALVTRHGEPFMQDEWGLRLKDDREFKAALGLRAVVLQLAEAKRRLGEPLQIDLRDTDAEYDRVKRIEEAARRLDAVLGEFGPQDQAAIGEAAQALHTALHPAAGAGS
jgi:hypothetical protein